jgi:Ca2+ transporting ATPase
MLLIFTFSADSWLPEYYPNEMSTSVPMESKFYSPSGHVRSGRAYMIGSTDEDYLRFNSEVGPSRHFTFVFNFFVMCQIFNFLNCRKIHEEFNILTGITRNLLFLFIVLAIFGLQLILGNLGGIPLSISFHGMDIRQWLIAVAFAAFTTVWNVILKLIPSHKICPKFGNKQTDPLQSSSKILGVKRSHNEETLHRKFSSLNRVEAKGGSLTKVQYHAVNH